MVGSMSVVVTVIVSIMNLMIPLAALCNLSVRHVVKLCNLGVFALSVSGLGFLECGDIYMCAVISGLCSSSLFLIPFMLTCNMMRFLLLLLLGLCLWVMSVVMWASLVCL